MTAVCANSESNPVFNVSHASSGCTTYIRSESTGACNVVPVGDQINNVIKKFKIYTGAIVAILGAVILFYGYKVLECGKKIVIGGFFWIILFGIGYNVCPPLKLSLTVIAIIAGATLLVAIIITCVAGEFIAKSVDNIVIGLVGAALFVFLAGLVSMDKNGKVVGICAIVGFTLGVLLACYNEAAMVFIKSYAMSFLGAYLLFYGISSYLNGFHAKKWTVFVYYALIIVATYFGGKYNNGIAVSDKKSKGNQNDAFNEDEKWQGAANQ